MVPILFELKHNNSEYPKLCGDTFPLLLWRLGPLSYHKDMNKLYKDVTGTNLPDCFNEEQRDVLRTNMQLIKILMGSQGGRKDGFYIILDVPIEFDEWHLWSVHDAPKSVFSTNEVLCLNVKALTKIQMKEEEEEELKTLPYNDVLIERLSKALPYECKGRSVTNIVPETWSKSNDDSKKRKI